MEPVRPIRSQKNKYCQICHKAKQLKREDAVMYEKSIKCHLIHEAGAILNIRDISYEMGDVSPIIKRGCACDEPDFPLKNTSGEEKKRNTPNSQKIVEKKHDSSQKKNNFSVKGDPTKTEEEEEEGDEGDELDQFKLKQSIRASQLSRFEENQPSHRKLTRVSKRPSWFVVVSTKQRRVLAQLPDVLHHSHCSGIVTVTREVLHSLGMYPPPRNNMLGKLNTGGTPVQFLSSVLLWYQDDKGDKESSGIWNRNLLMSCVCCLEFPLLREHLETDYSMKSYLNGIDPQDLLTMIVESKAEKFSCLTFPDIEHHPDLQRMMQTLAGLKLSNNQKKKLWKKAVKNMSCIRFINHSFSIPKFEGFARWDSIGSARKLANLKRKAFLDRLRSRRLIIGQEFWMATLPSFFADDKMLELFSSYMVTDHYGFISWR